LKVSFARPHSPYDPPPVYYEMYRDHPIPPPYVGDWAHIHDGREGAADVNAWRSRRPEHETRRARACYYGSVTFIDHQIGRLLYELRHYHRDAWQNTFVLFTSDHGDMLGDHHLWRKTYAYEGSARIPMILRPPDGWKWPRGLVLDHLVELRDVMPTFLEAAGAPIPENVDGKSLLPLARGETETPWRDVLLGEHDWCYSHEQANYYLTDGRWKFVWFPYLGTEQLFDLQQDPGECRNLSGDPKSRDVAGALRRRMVRELEARDCGLVEEGKLVRLRLDQVVRSPHLQRYACREE
ncbi:MAG: sulfatase-like hydrolase/transferase, partial [Armatimonadota bacterium]|nr:sulfatase-like hydrolase/transferase [Armatimonadota bacterium]